MSNDPKQQFLASLLSQDQPLSSATYEEYRTVLQSKLDAAVAKAHFARHVTVWVWVAAVLCLIAGGIVGMMDNRNHLPQPVLVVGFVVIVAGQVLFYYGLFRVFWYVAFERRAPQIVRQDLHDAMVLELTRKVDVLSQRLETLSPR